MSPASRTARASCSTGWRSCFPTRWALLWATTADDSGLGFAGGALLIGSAIALVVVARYWTRIPGVVLFWVAFVLTRPFGATLGDFLTKPHEKGGLDFGTVGSSAVLGGVLLVLVLMATVPAP